MSGAATANWPIPSQAHSAGVISGFFPQSFSNLFQYHVHFFKTFHIWTLQTHTSAYQLTFGAKCTTTTKTLHTSPKSDSCCRNFSKCSLSEYNDLKNTN